MTAISRALNAPWGRGILVLVGLELIEAAIQTVGGPAGALLVAIGLALLVAGVWGRSLVAAVTPRRTVP